MFLAGPDVPFAEAAWRSARSASSTTIMQTIRILKALYREFNAIDDIDSAQEVYDQLVLLTKELLAPLAERNLLPTSMMHK